MSSPAGQPPVTTLADARARLALSQDAASRGPAPVVLARPAPPGFTCWGVPGTRAVTCLPTLLPSAPLSVVRGYLARVEANLTGTCFICRATTWVSTDVDPEHTPAAWAVLDVTVGIVHAPGCSAVFPPHWRRWLDPRSQETR